MAFSKEFNSWYKDFLKKNNLKREQIFGDKKETWDVFHGEEVVLIDIHTLYEAFKGGQKSGKELCKQKTCGAKTTK